MAVFRSINGELYVNALVIHPSGSRWRPAFVVSDKLGKFYRLGLQLSCFVLLAIVTGTIASFALGFTALFDANLFITLFLLFLVAAVASSLMPVFLGRVQTVDIASSVLNLSLSRYYYLNFALTGVGAATFVALLFAKQRVQYELLLSVMLFSFFCFGIWSLYCYLSLEHKGAKR